ncbi:MAG: hypothetical protein IJA07_08285 [Agathobacter sp.]|nr:hypothetical protein [Agathobacter sp.]
MNLIKTRKNAIIIAIILAVFLIVSIIAFCMGVGKDKNADNQLNTEETVVDTTAPKADFAHRYVFTNDAANADFTGMFESIRDASECTIKLIRFERSGNLGLMDEKALKSLTDKINTMTTEDELKSIGSEEMPTEEGIYHAVMEIMDAHGNAAYEEIVLVLDKTGAKIEEAADKVVMVSKENLSAEPAVDKSEYEITDNVDGKIVADNIVCELELRDADKHEWLVHVSYVDRAGNESKATFLITVKEDAAPGTQSGNANAGNGGASSNAGNTGSNSNSGNGSTGNTTNTEGDKKSSNNQDTSTWVPTEDENVIRPAQQKIIDAGYGNVVDYGDGTYAVLVHADYTANGKDGYEILKEYLAEKDLEIVNSRAGIIDEDNDWYVYEAYRVRKIDNSGNEWTGDGEIEFID